MNNICPFCGRKAGKQRFCTACRREGFDNVYTVTGKTNGWDKELKRLNKPRVRSGWRGQRIGGNISHPCNKQEFDFSVAV